MFQDSVWQRDAVLVAARGQIVLYIAGCQNLSSWTRTENQPRQHSPRMGRAASFQPQVVRCVSEASSWQFQQVDASGKTPMLTLNFPLVCVYSAPFSVSVGILRSPAETVCRFDLVEMPAEPLSCCHSLMRRDNISSPELTALVLQRVFSPWLRNGHLSNHVNFLSKRMSCFCFSECAQGSQLLGLWVGESANQIGTSQSNTESPNTVLLQVRVWVQWKLTLLAFENTFHTRVKIIFCWLLGESSRLWLWYCFPNCDGTWRKVSRLALISRKLSLWTSVPAHLEDEF